MPNKYAQKSDMEWEKGKKCLEEGHFNAAANRLYYAVFMAVKGYAVFCRKMADEDSDNVHGRVLEVICPRNQLGRHMNQRKCMQGLCEQRIIADYLPEDADGEELKRLLECANQLRLEHLKLRNKER